MGDCLVKGGREEGGEGKKTISEKMRDIDTLVVKVKV